MRQQTSVSITLIVLLAAVLAGAGVWLFFDPVPEEGAEIQTFVEQHLENKYGEDVEVLDVKHTVNTGRYTFHVQLKGRPDWTFEVKMDSAQDRTPTDTYRKTVWHHQALDELQTAAGQWFSQPHPLFVNIGLPEELQESLYPNRAPAYQDLLRDHATEMSRFIELLVITDSEKADDADESIFRFIKHLQEQGVPQTMLEINLFASAGEAPEPSTVSRDAFYELKNKLDPQWITSISLEANDLAAIDQASDLARYKRDMRQR